MKIAKAIALITALVFAGLAFELLSLKRVQAADILEKTEWSGGDLFLEFGRNGWVELAYSPREFGDNAYVVEGDYQLNGNAVEVILDDGGRLSGTVNGNKMIVNWTNPSGSSGGKHVLTRK